MTAPRPLPASRHRVHPATVDDNRRRAAADALASRLGRAAADLAELLGPQLERPACAGLAPTFDRDVPGETDDERTARIYRAKGVCARCPVLAACAAAAASLPAESRAGVWAGVLYPDTPDRPAPADSGPAVPLPTERRRSA